MNADCRFFHMFKAVTICLRRKFFIFLFLTIVETTGLLFLKRGLEMGYLDTGAIILIYFVLNLVFGGITDDKANNFENTTKRQTPKMTFVFLLYIVW